jgi:hypothetical protein
MNRLMKCTRCRDTYWVCETHDDRPWSGDKACGCGGAGMPCRPAMFPIQTIRRGCRRAFSAMIASTTNEFAAHPQTRLGKPTVRRVER